MKKLKQIRKNAMKPKNDIATLENKLLNITKNK